MAENKTGIPLTEEEFKVIKAEQFKGETQSAICAIVNRSQTVVKTAMDSNDLEDYRINSRNKWQKYTKNRSGSTTPLENVQVHVLKPSTTYGRLKVFREQLDEVLIEFIVNEVKRNSEELVRENKLLKRKVESLEQQLSEAQSGSFISNLQEKLEPKVEKQPEADDQSNGHSSPNLPMVQ